MIYITGDTHVDFNDVLCRVSRNKISQGDTLIVAGDFGFTWGSAESESSLDQFESAPFTIAFVDGNHENFDKLYSYPVVDHCGGKAHQVRKNVFHLMRGEAFEIEGRSFFWFGGAYSVDKALRQKGISWWQQELPVKEDYDRASQTLERISYKTDYVITHGKDVL